MHPRRAEIASRGPDLCDLHLHAAAYAAPLRSQRQDVRQLFFGNGHVYPDHTQLRYSSWNRDSDRGWVPDLLQTRRQRGRLLPAFITGVLQDDSAGHGLTHLNRLDANFCQRNFPSCRRQHLRVWRLRPLVQGPSHRRWSRWAREHNLLRRLHRHTFQSFRRSPRRCGSTGFQGAFVLLPDWASAADEAV